MLIRARCGEIGEAGKIQHKLMAIIFYEKDKLICTISLVHFSAISFHTSDTQVYGWGFFLAFLLFIII